MAEKSKKPAVKKSGTQPPKKPPAKGSTQSKKGAKGTSTVSSTSTAKRPSQKTSTSQAKKSPASSSAVSKSNNTTKASAKKSQRGNAGGQPQNNTPQLTTEERHIQKLLGEGAYHLPGNSWFQDWWMHLSNGHPFFSICFQHRLHPVSKTMRAVQMLGSVAMGLIITNVMYIWFIHDNKQDEYFEELTKQNNNDIVQLSGLNDEQIKKIEQYTSVQLSPGMAVLWTVGSALHAMWDSSMFYVTSCTCCKWDQMSPMMQKTKQICNLFVIIGVILVTAIASMAIILRANLEGGGEVQVATLTSGNIEREKISNKDNYEFLLSYVLELASSWLIWFPIVDTILLSGVLYRCCRCLGGGRAAEMAEEAGDVEQGRRSSKK